MNNQLKLLKIKLLKTNSYVINLNCIKKIIFKNGITFLSVEYLLLK